MRRLEYERTGDVIPGKKWECANFRYYISRGKGVYVMILNELTQREATSAVAL